MLAVLFPCSSRLYCVNGLEEGLERGESSDAEVARSCWYLYSVAVLSLCTVCIMDSLKCLWHSNGLLPVKAVLVMLQVSLEGLGASELRLMMVGICCRNDWRVG